MKTRPMPYHELEIRFIIGAKELNSALDNGLRPEMLADWKAGKLSFAEAAALMFEEALTSNETGSADVEQLVISFDDHRVLDRYTTD